jgi:[NiFe] hydrogenase diaphorase moiety small subunit
MSDEMVITLDGVAITARAGQTILEAADAAGVYIPRLCHHPELHPFGACRVCTVLVAGRPQAACTTPVGPGMIIESESSRMLALRRDLIDMLFVEGNHYCMFCEKSGNCELQALAYRFGITAPRFPYQFPGREVDASHPDVMIDHNRCIQCARCVRASRDLDGKSVFGFVGRGAEKRIAVNAASGLGGTDVALTDRAVDVCPVGAILKKRTGFAVPVGRRLYDHAPIGSDVEARRADQTK